MPPSAARAERAPPPGISWRKPPPAIATRWPPPSPARRGCASSSARGLARGRRLGAGEDRGGGDAAVTSVFMVRAPFGDAVRVAGRQPAAETARARRSEGVRTSRPVEVAATEKAVPGAADLARGGFGQPLGGAVEDDAALAHADHAVAAAPRGVERVQVADDGEAVLLVNGARRRRHDLAFVGSDEATGSSARTGFEPCISAWAMATRCRWPPDSASARLVACSAMPRRSSGRSAHVPVGERVEGGADRAHAFAPAEHDVEPRPEIGLPEDRRAVAPPAAQRRGGPRRRRGRRGCARRSDRQVG